MPRTIRTCALAVCATLLLSLVSAAVVASSPAVAATPPASNGALVYDRGIGGQFSDLYVTPDTAAGVGQFKMTDNIPTSGLIVQQIFQKFATSPAFSADGHKVAFKELDGISFTGGIRILSFSVPAAASGPLNPISSTTLVADGTGYDHPTWSPDNARLAFDNGPTGIWTVNVDGTGLTKVNSNADTPSWGSTGRIAYIGYGPIAPGHPDGTSAVYTMNPDGTNVVKVTNLENTPGGEFLYGPAFSPDGSKIAFKDTAAPAHLYVVNGDGTGLHAIGTAAGDPIWSPDGTKIAFVNTAPLTGSPAIVIENTDGTGAISFTPSYGLAACIGAPNSYTNCDTYPLWGDLAWQPIPGAAPVGNTPVGSTPATCLQPAALLTPACRPFLVSVGTNGSGTGPLLLASFGSVTVAGNTTALPTGTVLNVPPDGYTGGTPAFVIDVTTTATYSAPVVLCFDYSGTVFANTAGLRVFHLEGGAWVDRTVASYPANDLICASASSLSPFALFTDTAAPTTTATTTPAPSAAGWNTSDVSVTLTAVDQPGGSGVASIRYSVNGVATTAAGDHASVTVAADGTTTIRYASTDNAGNSEAERTLTVRIDRTAPEAAISFDPATADLGVSVCDTGSGPGTIGVTRAALLRSDDGVAERRTYTLTDGAGNATTVVVDVRQHGHELKATVVSVAYGASAPTSAAPNELSEEWSSIAGTLHELEQSAEIRQGATTTQIEAHYSARTGITRIEREVGETETHATAGGLVLVRLVTDHGGLTIEP